MFHHFSFPLQMLWLFYLLASDKPRNSMSRASFITSIWFWGLKVLTLKQTSGLRPSRKYPRYYFFRELTKLVRCIFKSSYMFLKSLIWWRSFNSLNVLSLFLPLYRSINDFLNFNQVRPSFVPSMPCFTNFIFIAFKECFTKKHIFSRVLHPLDLCHQMMGNQTPSRIHT